MINTIIAAIFLLGCVAGWFGHRLYLGFVKERWETSHYGRREGEESLVGRVPSDRDPNATIRSPVSKR